MSNKNNRTKGHEKEIKGIQREKEEIEQLLSADDVCL